MFFHFKDSYTRLDGDDEKALESIQQFPRRRSEAFVWILSTVFFMLTSAILFLKLIHVHEGNSGTFENGFATDFGMVDSCR